MTFDTCPEIFNDENLPGLTNEKGCPKNFCFINGTQCHGNIVSNLILASEDECLAACINNVDCKWFEFESQTKMCSLLGDCSTFDNDCPNCIIGSRDCPERMMTLLFGLGEDENGTER